MVSADSSPQGIRGRFRSDQGSGGHVALAAAACGNVIKQQCSIVVRSSLSTRYETSPRAAAAPDLLPTTACPRASHRPHGVKGNVMVITKQASGTAKIDPLMAAFNAIALRSTNPGSTRPGLFFI
jgi:hypothetical protein